MSEKIPHIDPRRIREMCKKDGFSGDARELCGFRMERVEEMLGEGFDLMTQSPRAENDPLNNSLSLKVMKNHMILIPEYLHMRVYLLLMSTLDIINLDFLEISKKLGKTPNLHI